MKKENKYMTLKHTPFVAIERPGILCPFAIGRIDNRHLLCLGTFNDKFADGYNEGEVVFLRISPDGSAVETYSHDIAKLVKPCSITLRSYGGFSQILPNQFLFNPSSSMV